MSMVIIIDNPHLEQRIEECADLQGVKPDELVGRTMSHCEQLKLIDNIITGAKTRPEQWGG